MFLERQGHFRSTWLWHGVRSIDRRDRICHLESLCCFEVDSCVAVSVGWSFAVGLLLDWSRKWRGYIRTIWYCSWSSCLFVGKWICWCMQKLEGRSRHPRHLVASQYLPGVACSKKSELVFGQVAELVALLAKKSRQNWRDCWYRKEMRHWRSHYWTRRRRRQRLGFPDNRQIRPGRIDHHFATQASQYYWG